MNMRKIKWIVVHCSATRKGADIKGKSIAAGHLLPVSKGGRGWKAPGYHYIVELDGNIYAALPEEKISNGVKGHNAEAVNVCYIGGVNAASTPEDTRTPAQKESLRRLLSELRERYPHARIAGHRDLSPDLDGDGRITPREWTKACPSFDAAAEYRGI